MNQDRIASLLEWGVAFDTETHLGAPIQPGLACPPLVCASIARRVDGRTAGELLDKARAREAYAYLLQDERFTIITANGPYDHLVMAADAALRGVDLLPLIYRAFKVGRCWDILTQQALHAVALGTLNIDPRTGKEIINPETGRMGTYSLPWVADYELGRANVKAAGRFRMSYALLEDIPVAEWPLDARSYPVDDTVNTFDVGVAQAGHMPRRAEHEWDEALIDGRPEWVCRHCAAVLGIAESPPCPPRARPQMNIHILAEQAFKAFCLARAGAWGLTADEKSIDELEDAALEGMALGRDEFIAAGLIRDAEATGEDKDTKDTAAIKRAVAIAYGCTGKCDNPKCEDGLIWTYSKRDPTVRTKQSRGCTDCSATGVDLSTAPVPMTAPTEKMVAKGRTVGNVQAGRDILVESGDELLMSLAAWQEDSKVLTTYCPFLRDGVDRPVVLKANPVLETLRVSYWGVVQLLPRQVSAHLSARLRASGSKVVGVRDCFCARPGCVYVSVDYGGGELVTFAESAVRRVGWSDMGQILNRGADVHSATAAQVLGLGYDEFYKRLKVDKDKQCKAYRQAAKPFNFGVPGTMGTVRIVLNNREQGPDTPHPSGPSLVWDGEAFVPGYKGTRFCVLVGGERCGAVKVQEWGREGYERPCPPTCRACLEVAEQLKSKVFQTYSELRPYLNWHSENADKVGWVDHWANNYRRGGVDYGAEANGDFQAGLAIITGRALLRVSEEQNVRTIVRTASDVKSAFEGEVSPLLGSQVIVFMHDELFSEAPKSQGHEVALRKKEIMEEEFKAVCTHHQPACKAEQAMAPRWWKGMEPVFHGGRLAEWTPGHNPKKCEECAA